MTSYRDFISVGSLWLAVVTVALTAQAGTAIDWVGGGADNLTTTLANWSIGGATPAELPDLTGGTLDVTIKGGTGMTYRDGDKFNTMVSAYPITNADETVTFPFVIKPETAGAALYLENGFTSSKMRQIVISGRITHSGSTVPTFTYGPWCVGWGEKDPAIEPPPGVIAGYITSSRGRSAPLVMDGVEIDMNLALPLGAMITGIHVNTNTENLVTGSIDSTSAQNGYSMCPGSKLTAKKGHSSTIYIHQMGPGEFRVENSEKKTLSGGSTLESGYTLTLAGAPHTYDVAGNSSREGLLMWQSTVNFVSNNVLTETTQFSFDRSTQLNKVEFNATTQRIGRVQFVTSNTGSYLRGDYGSMLEITGVTRTGATAKYVKELKCNAKVKGGLGIHMMGAATDRFMLYDQAFESGGDLLVSSGTNCLASGATWLNGTNFVMSGTGVMQFAKAGQVNRDFAEFHFSDSGKVYIPSGVTLETAYAVIDGETERLMHSGDYGEFTTAGEMTGRVVGGGVLRVRYSNRDHATYTETDEDMTKDADWEVSVDEGCTNVVKVTQTNHKIIKYGKGILMLNASNDVSGIDIDAGYVYVGANDCLGRGPVTIAGQRDGYTGPCGLRFSTDGVTNSANVVVTGNTTLQYPAFFINSTTNAFLGSITAAQDFMILDEVYYLWEYYYELQKPSVGGLWSVKVKAHIGMDFGGAIDVAGKFHLLPDSSYNFRKPVRAGVFETRLTDDNQYRIHQDSDTGSYGVLYFYDTNQFGELLVGYRTIEFYGTNSLGGAMIRSNLSNSQGGTINIYNYTNYIAGAVHPNPTELPNNSNLITGNGTATLVITGSTENVVTYTKFSSMALLRLDAAENPDFTMTMMGRDQNIAGPLDINAGTLILTNDTKFTMTELRIGENGKLIVGTDIVAFPDVTTLEVAGEISGAANVNVFPTSLALTTFKLSSTAQLNCKLPSTISTSYFYIDGVPTCFGKLTHANYAAIPEGMTVNVTGMVEPQVTAVWTGNVSSDMSVLGNWLVDNEIPQSLDLVNGTTRVIIGANGTEMAPGGDSVRIHSISVEREANTTNPQFIIGAPGKTIYIDYSFIATNQCQLKLRGTFAAPLGIDQGACEENGKATFTYKAKSLAKGKGHSSYEYPDQSSMLSLMLDGVIIAKPTYIHAGPTGGDVYCATVNSVNEFAGAFNTSCNGWQTHYAGDGAVVKMSGTFVTGTRLVKKGAGVLLFDDTYVDNAGVKNKGLNIEGGEVVVATTNAEFGTAPDKNQGIKITGSDTTLRFTKSFAFKDNDCEQLESTGKVKTTVDFGSTTQRLSRVRANSTHKDSSFTGVYPAMLEVKGGTKWTATANVLTPMYISEPITGGLGIHYLGNGPANTKSGTLAGSAETFVLSNATFTSCGNLEVSAGTLELASDATWKNGTNFVARGTGTLRFTKDGQVNGEIAALHLAGSGKVEIPSGIILKVASAETNGVELAIGSYTATELGSFISGGGTLKVGKKGTTIMLW